MRSEECRSEQQDWQNAQPARARASTVAILVGEEGLESSTKTLADLDSRPNLRPISTEIGSLEQVAEGLLALAWRAAELGDTTLARRIQSIANEARG